MTGFSPEVISRMRDRLSRRFGFAWGDVEPLRLASGVLCPALVVHDRGDDSIPFDEGVALAGTLPQGRLLETDGLGHHRLLRDESVVEKVAEFASAGVAERAPGPAFDFAGVRLATEAPSGLRPGPFSQAFDPIDLRLSDAEIARELAFGRD
jgi:hypothetical protein